MTAWAGGQSAATRTECIITDTPTPNPSQNLPGIRQFLLILRALKVVRRQDLSQRRPRDYRTREHTFMREAIRVEITALSALIIEKNCVYFLMTSPWRAEKRWSDDVCVLWYTKLVSSIQVILYNMMHCTCSIVTSNELIDYSNINSCELKFRYISMICSVYFFHIFKYVYRMSYQISIII